jgi:hypothetical protein
VGAPYFTTLPILYVFYLLFGITPAYWTITVLLLHALNSFLVYHLSHKIIKTIFNNQSRRIAFFTALIFLISPYQTENIFWISINRLFHCAFTLGGLYFFIKYLEMEEQKEGRLEEWKVGRLESRVLGTSFRYSIVIHLFFLLALFSYELTFIFPLIYIAIFVLFNKLNLTQCSFKKFFIQIILPQLFFISGYFFVCKLLSGHWLWHGGTTGDIIQTFNWAKTLLKYFAKFFLFYRYLPNNTIDIFFRTLAENYLLTEFLCLSALAAFAFFFVKLIQQKKSHGFFLSAIFICFLISLLPLLSLDTSFLKYIYPDRYGYLPSFFFYLFLVSLCFSLLPKIATLLLAGYSALCWILLTQTLCVWKTTSDYCTRLIREYKPFLKYNKVYVLNIPAYYYGVAAFRSTLAQTIFMQYKYPAEIETIAGSYYESPADSLLSVNKIDSNTFEVKGNFKRRTPYFSTDAGWAKSYETDSYKVTFDSSGCSYILTFKQKIPENSAFIYSSSEGWKKAE